MGIRTGMGDSGFAELLFQRRISKDSPEMHAMGDLDELNSFLGLVKAKLRTRKKKDVIERVQRAIYTIASEIALGHEKTEQHGLLLGDKDTDWLEGLIYELERKTDIKSYFYLPGDNEISALTDIARSVARRAERSVVILCRKKKLDNRNILSYLNGISDLLYIMARKRSRRKKGRVK